MPNGALDRSRDEAAVPAGAAPGGAEDGSERTQTYASGDHRLQRSAGRPARSLARKSVLALGVLRRLAGTLETGLLAFLHARIARQQTELAEG